MSEKILVPYDRSDPSQEALRYACEKFSDSDITVIYVIEVRGQEEWYIPQAMEDRADEAEDVFDSAREIAGDRAIDTEALIGIPDQAILDYAEENDFELIIMGSHGRRGIGRRILGSVAERVVRHSSIPVLVAR